jgi:3-oxoacyl-[acyl-carrier protein] reductase
MNLNLADKVFVVSGSSRGIGKGIAEVLLAEGARIILTGRDPVSLASTFDELHNKFSDRVLQCAGDLSEIEILKRVEKLVLQKWSQIDGVIANAGAVKPVAEWDIPEADWEWYFDANFNVAIRFVTQFIPHLKQTKGSIVFISSIAGVEDIGAPLPYSSSKAALTMYAKGLARKLARDRIRVNTVAPGNIIFPGGNWYEKQKANPEAIHRMLEEKVPLQQFGTPEDIGNMVAFLVSEKARFITGSCFVVDGGQTSLFI